MPLPREPVPAIHKAVAENRYRIGWHAVQHMFEEGFDTANLLEVLKGKLVVLEDYEEDSRVLVAGVFRVSEKTKCPLHVVCDFSTADSVDVVTAYIPSGPQWVNPRQRA